MNTHSNLVVNSTRQSRNAASGATGRARAIESVRLELLSYFATIGAEPERVYTIRDFNSQVMMNAYSPAERARLGQALAELLDAGILRQRSPTEYLLTAAGEAVVKAKRRERSVGPQTAPPTAPANLR